MVGILLRKQLAGMYKSYFYDSKKGTLRSKGAVLLRFGGFALLMVVLFGGFFGYISYLLCDPFCSLGLGWMYFVIMGLIAIALGSFGSVFNTFAGLYLAKDNDLLLSMPIPVSAIMASRLLGVYLTGLLYSGFVALGAVVVYFVVCGFSFGALLGGLVYVFFISVVVLILSCLLGWVVAKISVKLKNKSFISVFVSLVGIGLYYFFYFRIQSVLPNLIYNAAIYGQEVKSHAFFLYGFGRMAEGSWLAILACMAVSAAAFALTWFVLKSSFVSVVTGGAGGTGGLGKKRFGCRSESSDGSRCEILVKPKSVQGSPFAGVRPKSVRGALLAREFERFKGSASYMLNCGLGTLILLVLAVALQVKMDTVREMLVELGVPGNAFLVLGSCAICLVAGTNDMATPSVSLEGTRLWILQSLPVSAWDVLKAKLGVQILLTAPFAVLCVISLSFVLCFGFAEFLVSLVLVVGFVFFMALFDLMLGLKLPNLTWTNELTPIKQSLAVFIAVFGGWAYIGAIVGLYFLVGSSLREFFGAGVSGGVSGALDSSGALSASGAFGDVLFLGAFAVLIWVLCAVLAGWLKNKGSKVLERL